MTGSSHEITVKQILVEATGDGNIPRISDEKGRNIKSKIHSDKHV